MKAFTIKARNPRDATLLVGLLECLQTGAPVLLPGGSVSGVPPGGGLRVDFLSGNTLCKRRYSLRASRDQGSLLSKGIQDGAPMLDVAAVRNAAGARQYVVLARDQGALGYYEYLRAQLSWDLPRGGACGGVRWTGNGEGVIALDPRALRTIRACLREWDPPAGLGGFEGDHVLGFQGPGGVSLGPRPPAPGGPARVTKAALARFTEEMRRCGYAWAQEGECEGDALEVAKVVSANTGAGITVGRPQNVKQLRTEPRPL